MHTPLHLAAIAAALTISVPATAGAATIRLVPIGPTVVGPSIASCSVPYAPAELLAAPLEIPAIAAQQRVTGVSQVLVRLDAAGHVRRESLLATSGNRWLDAAARRAARLARYSSEVRACERIGGEYAMVVDFTQ